MVACNSCEIDLGDASQVFRDYCDARLTESELEALKRSRLDSYIALGNMTWPKVETHLRTTGCPIADDSSGGLRSVHAHAIEMCDDDIIVVSAVGLPKVTVPRVAEVLFVTQALERRPLKLPIRTPPIEPRAALDVAVVADTTDHDEKLTAKQGCNDADVATFSRVGLFLRDLEPTFRPGGPAS